MSTMPKKIATINDITGYGRCAISVALPVISAMGIQCCLVPTSILSNHTGFPNFFFDDYTDRMPAYIGEWKKLGLSFDGILTGFLGSAQQMEIVEEFIRDFKQPSTRLIVDPIMGDNGKVYQTCTAPMCRQMKRLAAQADLLTPNLTEACILTDTPYQEHFGRKEIAEIIRRLALLCPGRLVITGIRAGNYLCNAVYEPNKEIAWIRRKRISAERCGTGDIFSAILAANAIKDIPLTESVKQASGFIQLCLSHSEKYLLGKNEGVCFEPLLGRLAR